MDRFRSSHLSSEMVFKNVFVEQGKSSNQIKKKKKNAYFLREFI